MGTIVHANVGLGARIVFAGLTYVSTDFARNAVLFTVYTIQNDTVTDKLSDEHDDYDDDDDDDDD